MSQTHAQNMAQQLQDIRERLDALLITYKDQDEPRASWRIRIVHQVVDLLESVAPEAINSEALGALTELIQGMDVSRAKVPLEVTALDEEGIARFSNFHLQGDPYELELAVACWLRAITLTPDGHNNKPRLLSNLGAALLTRFEQVGSLADLDAAIAINRNAVNLTRDNHANKPMYLNNLGNALQRRFSRHGLLDDLEDAILQHSTAASLTPDNHPNKPMYLTNFGNGLEMRFGRRSLLADLETAISQKRKAVNLAPDDHPQKPQYLDDLGCALQIRFQWHGLLVDLEDAILQKQKAVDLAPDGQPNKPGYLCNLGSALIARFDRQGLLEDLETGILYQQKAVDLTSEEHPNKPIYLNGLGRALLLRYEWHASLADLENAILQLQKAVSLTPNDSPRKPCRLDNLGSALTMRFGRNGSLADLEDGILRKREAVDLTPDDHLDKPRYLANLGTALETRYTRHGSLADLEDTILQQRKAIDLTPDGHHDKPMYLGNLGNAIERRFERCDSLADLEDAILQKRKAVDLTPDGHPHKAGYLSNLGCALQSRFGRSGLLKDLEDAMSQIRKAVDITPDNHREKAGYLNNLGNTSERMFDRSGAIPDLDDAIKHRQRAIRLVPKGHPDSVQWLTNLSVALRIRYQRLGDHDDLQRALSAAEEAAKTPSSSPRHQLLGARLWALCCALGSTSLLPAFECAIRLLPRIAWLGLAVDDQYFLLAEVGTTTQSAVEAAIAEGEYAKAIEWAEQGRSIVWQNLLSLRTPLDVLRHRFPDLAIQLQELSQRLEQPMGTRSVLDGSTPIDVGSNPITLAMERDRLIDEIRIKPGFETFMKPKSLKELAPAAQEGTVVFINLGRARCDALSLLSDETGASRVVLVPLERVTLESAEQLSRKLMNLLSSSGIRARHNRKHKIHGVSDDMDAVFKEILKTLWLDYVQPILDGLAYQVNIESPPRLWWCTTGPGVFLPLHAAGLYDVKEVGHKLSDFAVSSYTPTLTSLLDKSSHVSSNEIKILTVAISNTPGAPLPCTEKEVQKLQYLMGDLPVVNLKNEEATREHVLKELEEGTWAHLACHGEQVGGKPMESGLILHDGKLKLSEIVKTRLPNAEFAFLSACQTAVGDGGVPEESAHLAAGMLFAGYRGVVATMWSIQDDIAPRVAEDFYRYMFRNGQPKREEAAYALHRAVSSLQEADVPFTSWVPFIHIGR